MIINVDKFKKEGEKEFDFIYRKRLILFSVDREIFVDNLREAKNLARKKCKEQKCHVSVYHHSPFEINREYISIFYGEKRLKYFYLHLDALCAKSF